VPTPLSQLRCSVAVLSQIKKRRSRRGTTQSIRSRGQKNQRNLTLPHCICHNGLPNTMSVLLPRGFISIKDAANAGGKGSFIGVLTQIQEPFQSKGDDLILQFTIQDEFSGDSVGHHSTSSISCRLFRRSKDELPKNGAIGDIALLRNVSISKFIDRINLTCGSRDGVVLFFNSQNIPRPELSTPYGEGGLSQLPYTSTFAAQPPTWTEQLAIIRLKAAANPLLPKVQNYSAMRASQPARKDKRSLIQDLTIHNYHDIVGEVVKMFNPSSMSTDLYITDYTTNQDLFLYEDPDDPEVEDFGYSKARKWPGPFGQMTLQIRLWHPHSTWATEHVREGDLVLLTDVHAKFSGVNKLEGALHQDQKYPDKVKISKAVLSKDVRELRSRKAKHQAEYGKPRDGQGQAVADGAPKKPSAKIAAKKRETKKDMQRLQKELEQQELEKKAEDKAIARAGINPHGKSSSVGFVFDTTLTFPKLLRLSLRSKCPL
jgi:protection-of-telomeres protein 1